MLSKEFRTYINACHYKDIANNNGYKAWIEEMYDFSGKFYLVLV